MVIDLYHVVWSPPSRAERLLGRAIGVKFNLITCNPLEGTHLKPEFVRLDPMHTVPTMKDGGFVLWESRAINHYLIGKYAPDSALVPKDCRARGVYDQRMFFEYSLLNNLSSYARATIFTGRAREDPEGLKRCIKSMELLEVFLKEAPYVAGSQLSVVDYSVAAAVSTGLAFEEMNAYLFPNVSDWLKRVSAEIVDFQEINEPGVEMMRQIVKTVRSRL